MDQADARGWRRPAAAGRPRTRCRCRRRRARGRRGQASAGRSAAASRTVSSLNPNRAATTAREWSSMNANRYVLRPATTGPCRASPVHSSLGRAASNRPNTCGLPSGSPGRSSSRTKWRCRVRSEGAHPAWARRIRAICAAVRAGVLPLERHRQLQHLRRSPRGHPGRGRHQRLEPARAPRPHPPPDGLLRHPDLVARRPGVLAGGQLAHPPPALAGDSAGSVTSWISEYRNNATCRARSARRRASSRPGSPPPPSIGC